jgi:hypothetical protein
MGAERRVKRFEDWSKEHGRSSRESDRRRVALELFDLSSGARVEPHHVDALAKKYRDGLMGANAILHARAVAEDLMAWQEEAGSSEDDASGHFSEPPPPRETARPRPNDERGRHSEVPPPKPGSMAPSARSERPPKWQDAALGRHDSTPLSRSDLPPRGDRRDDGSSPPPRRSEAPVYEKSRLAESTAPPQRKASEPPARGRGIASLDSLPPAKPAAGDLFDDLDGLGPGDRPISSVPPQRQSPSPMAPHRADSDRPRRSSPSPAACPPVLRRGPRPRTISTTSSTRRRSSTSTASIGHHRCARRRRCPTSRPRKRGATRRAPPSAATS